MIGLAARIITSTKRWNKCANEMGGVGVTEDNNGGGRIAKQSRAQPSEQLTRRNQYSHVKR